MIALTARERTVLDQIADGSTTVEIAAELRVKNTTVQAVVQQLIEKLGARNRVHAVALAYHRGLLLPRGSR
jgi:two-component system nitrate/nitrite response regulator NarL